MIWRRWGLKDNPYHLHPIDEASLDLFTGREREIQLLKSWSADKSNVILMFSPDGVGSSAIGNYLRFDFLRTQTYFTPCAELMLSRDFSLAQIASNLLAASLPLLRQKHPFLIRDETYVKADTLLKKMAVLNEGESGKNRIYGWGINSMANENFAIEALELCRDLVLKLGYERGVVVLLQFVTTPSKIRSLAINDCARRLHKLFQVEGLKWVLMANEALTDFFTAELLPQDTVDYSILRVGSLGIQNVKEVLERRKEKLAFDSSVQLPLDSSLLEYLYGASAGKIRQTLKVSSLILSLFDTREVCNVIDSERAVPVLAKYFQDQIYRAKLSSLSLDILKLLTQEGGTSSGEIAKRLRRRHSNVSRVLALLVYSGLVQVKPDTGDRRARVYTPLMESRIAFSHVS